MAISLAASGAAGSDRAVVFACDARYARYALMAADQIARLHPERDFDICLASTEALAVPASLADRGIRCCQIDVGDAFRGLAADARRGEAMYLRLALPAAMAPDYRRLLYLDSDVFVQGGDFAGLLAVDLRGHAIGAVRDNIQWRTPGRRAEIFRGTGQPAARYFNSGVMLIDVAAFNAEQILERCRAFGHWHLATRPDQDALNSLLHGDWAELSPVWNWQYTRASQLFEALATAHVVHFIGAKKPWSHHRGTLPLRFRRSYRAFLAAHYPDDPPLGPDGMEPMQNRAYYRGVLLRHLVAHRAMAAYLARFESDLAVL